MIERLIRQRWRPMAPRSVQTVGILILCALCSMASSFAPRSCSSAAAGALLSTPETLFRASPLHVHDYTPERCIPCFTSEPRMIRRSRRRRSSSLFASTASSQSSSSSSNPATDSSSSSATDESTTTASPSPERQISSSKSKRPLNQGPRRQNKRRPPPNKQRSNSNSTNTDPSHRRHIRSLFTKAKDLERKGQWRKAVAMLEEILQLEPTDAHSHLALARLEARRSPGTSKAVKAFETGTTVCPNSVHLWQAWAVHCESVVGDAAKARVLFERALSLEPNNPYVCHAFGLMERKAGNPDAAVALWNRALEKQSTAALVCSLGELLISVGRHKETRDLYSRHTVRLKTEREKTEVYLASAWLEERYFMNFDRAVELIQHSLAMSPTSSLAQVALARLEGRRRERQQGEDANQATVRKLASACIGVENGSAQSQPEDGRVYNAWANLEVKARRFAAARKILQKGLDRYPRDHSLLQAAGKVEERVGNYTGARELFGESLRVQPSAPTLVGYAMLELRQPESGSSDLDKVKRLFEEALLIDRRHGPAYNAYGNAELRQGNIEAARKVFKRGVRANCSDSASIYHGYAKLELTCGNVDRARELLLRGRVEAQRHDIGMDSPHRERALFLSHTLGMLELNSNHPTDALDVFRDGIERYGNSSQLLLGAALCEVKLGNESRARKLFEKSVLHDDKHAQAWQAWGVMEMRAGNWRAAQTLFECGMKSAPKHGALWHAYATMQGRLGNVENARALFTKGIKRAPNHVPLYQGWALLELREENYQAAKALITQALTRDKRNGSCWIVAAEIEEHLGNDGLVNLLLRRGIECSPTDANLYLALGNSLVRRGKINEAREIFEKGIEVDPVHAPLYHALAELEARVFNIEGLAKLNKRAAQLFNNNALEPPAFSSAAWGAKIKAGRSRDIPKGVAALAQRIVEDDGYEVILDDADPDSFIDSMSSTLYEDGLVGQLLNMDPADSPPEDETNASD